MTGTSRRRRRRLSSPRHRHRPHARLEGARDAVGGFGVINAVVRVVLARMHSHWRSGSPGHVDAPHAPRVGGSATVRCSAAEPRGAGHVRPHIAIANLVGGGLQRASAPTDCSAASARTTTTSASSRSRSTSWRIRRAVAIRTTSSSPARARRSSATTCVTGWSSPGKIGSRRRCARSSPNITAPDVDRVLLWRRRASATGASTDARRSSTYPGPVRRVAETAIVHARRRRRGGGAADCGSDPERVREVIDRVVRQRIGEGQLRGAADAARDRRGEWREFARVLGGMYHARVEYPKAVATSEPATGMSRTVHVATEGVRIPVARERVASLAERVLAGRARARCDGVGALSSPTVASPR